MIAFSENPNPDPDHPTGMRDHKQNIYLSFDADMKVHKRHSGYVQFSGRDSRGIWLGTTKFECLVDNKVMARVANTVYTGTCLPNEP